MKLRLRSIHAGHSPDEWCEVADDIINYREGQSLRAKIDAALAAATIEDEKVWIELTEAEFIAARPAFEELERKRR